MIRTRAILLGLFILALALPPAAWAVTTVEGTDGTIGVAGAVQKDLSTVNAAHPSGQGFCKQTARGAVLHLPSGAVVSLNNCSTSNVSGTDIMPPPIYLLPGSLTVSGTGTATASVTSTSTGTITATATVTGTGTGAGTGTITGTGTGTATGVATLTKTDTGTVTVTVTGSFTSTSSTTETNATIGNPAAAPALLSIGTSGQAQFDAQGNEVSTGTMSITHSGVAADFGLSGSAVSLGSASGTSVLGFNSGIDATAAYKYGRGSNSLYAGGLAFVNASGQTLLYNSASRGWDGSTFSPTYILSIDRLGDIQALGSILALSTISGTNLTSGGHAAADLLLPASGVCSAGQVLTYLTTGAPTCVTNGSGTGIGCSGTCSSPNWAVFTDSTHITSASYTPLNPASGVTTTCTKPTFTGGQATGCASATYTDVGADAAGAATSAVNAAVSGTTNYVAKFNSTNSIYGAYPFVAGSTTHGVPLTDNYDYLVQFMPPTRIPLYSGSMMPFTGITVFYSGAIYINLTEYVPYGTWSLEITWKQTAGAVACVDLSAQSGSGLSMSTGCIPAADGNWYHSSFAVTSLGAGYSGIFYAHVQGGGGTAAGLVGEITIKAH